MTEDNEDQQARGSIPTLIRAPDDLREAISERLPELRPALESIAEILPSFVAFIHGSDDRPEALTTIVTQGSNDLVDILFDVSCGRGRSAIMSARSLFELVVAAKDVRDSPPLDSRYRAHRAVVRQIEARLRIETNELSGAERKADLHRRKKLERASRGESAEAIQLYGNPFARTWAPADLRSRAEKHGMEEDYDFFRIASAVLHGSAGGSLGLISEIEGRLVHRQGQSLYLCPLALLEGLRLFAELVKACGRKHSGPAFDGLLSAIHGARKLYPAYRKAITKLDEVLWPEVPPPEPMAVLAVLPLTGAERWYLHNPVLNLVCLADRPITITEEQEQSLLRLKEKIREHGPVDTDWFPIGLPGIKATPKAGARWQPAGTVLYQPTFGTSLHYEPLDLENGEDM